MPPSSTTRETLQVAVLRSLNACHPMGLTAQDLLTPVKLGTALHDLTESDLRSLLVDMSETGLVKSEPSTLNRAVLRWKRTEQGRATLESLGLL